MQTDAPGKRTCVDDTPKARSRTLNRLSAREVEAATKPGLYMDGGGLILRVAPSGTKSWIYRYTRPKQPRRDMGLGSADKGHVTLKQARELADEARKLVQKGIDPMEARREKAAVERAEREAAKAAITFAACADEYLARKLPRFANEKHRYQWRRTLETMGDLSPAGGKRAAAFRTKRIKDITREDVLAVLEPVWDVKHETAARLRGRLESVFDYAIQNRRYFGDNPARWELFNETLSQRRKLSKRGHLPAMPRADLSGFIATLRAKGGIAAFALEFLILGANRSGEVRLATWDEMDLEDRLWIIPGARMKIKRRANGEHNDHAVVLTPRMVAILEAMRPHRKPPEQRRANDGRNVDFVFPGQKDGQPLSDMTLRMLMRRMLTDPGDGEGSDEKSNLPTVHGFRSTFRDWAGSDTHFPRELAEEALSHTLPDVERTYRREQAIAKRRTMMEAWEAFCEGMAQSDKVVQLRA